MGNQTIQQKTRHANPHYVSDKEVIAETGLTADEMIKEIQRIQGTVQNGIYKGRDKQLIEAGADAAINIGMDVAQSFSPPTMVIGIVQLISDSINKGKKIYKITQRAENEQHQYDMLFEDLYQQVRNMFPSK